MKGDQGMPENILYRYVDIKRNNINNTNYCVF